jgi:hypothetical protein
MNESFEIPANFDWLASVAVELVDAVDRVKELHKQVPGPYDDYICDHCSSFTPFASEVIPYPCPTIKTIEGK